MSRQMPGMGCRGGGEIGDYLYSVCRINTSHVHSSECLPPFALMSKRRAGGKRIHHDCIDVGGGEDTRQKRGLVL